MDINILPGEEKLNTLVEIYYPTITQCINNRRSAVQSALKGLFSEWAKDHGDTFIPLEAIVNCLKRDVKPDDEVWQFYWTKLLPHSAGLNYWDHNNYLHGTIIETKTNEKPDGPSNVTAASEGFVALLWDNCGEKWEKEFQFKKANPKVKIAQNDKRFVAKYSRSDTGQTRFGGWTEEGINRFKMYMDMAKAGRKKDGTLQLEKDTLKLLQEENKIEENNQAQSGKKRKRAAHQGPIVPFELDDEA